MSQVQPPPMDLDAEGAVLATLLLDPDRIASVEAILKPDDFYSDANRRIAATIWELDRQAQAVDIVTVATLLKSRGQLDSVGGSSYLAQLTDGTPAVAHVEDHARTVAAAARIRRLQALCRLVAAEGYTALQNAPQWLQEVEARVFAVTDTSNMAPETIAIIGDAVKVEYDELRDRANGKKPAAGIPTKIVALDKILHGLVDAVPYVVAGRPGHGKTAIALQVATAVARQGYLVVFLSQEMPKPQLVQRAIAQWSGIEQDKLRCGNIAPDEWVGLTEAVQNIETLPLAIDDRAGQTVHGCRSAVRRAVQKLRAKGYEGRLGLIVLDYLQIMTDDRNYGDSRATAVGENMHGLTRMAKEFCCPVMVLSQLNREIDKRQDKRPQLSDLFEAGAIEADAYAVIFVYREDCYRDPSEHNGEADIIVAKQRNGITGTAKMRYATSTLFMAPADEWDGDFQDGES